MSRPNSTRSRERVHRVRHKIFAASGPSRTIWRRPPDIANPNQTRGGGGLGLGAATYRRASPSRVAGRRAGIVHAIFIAAAPWVHGSGVRCGYVVP
jgi:hypothetical protein